MQTLEGIQSIIEPQTFLTSKEFNNQFDDF